MNQMRFFSSSALAKAAKFRFAASCSAADAMVCALNDARRLNAGHASGGQASRSRAAAGSGRMWGGGHASATAPRIVTEPPAFSIAARADLEAPATSKASFAVSSPSPRIFTPSRGFERTPAATSASPSTGAPCVELAGVDRLLDAAEIDLVQVAGDRRCVKPRFGRRRWSGIWPPSKPLMATPVRAFWPLTPRPAGLALAGADAAADAHPVLRRAVVVANFVEFHGARPQLRAASTTRTRCWTFAIMPRTAGVSSSVALRCILLSPRPISVCALPGVAADRAADLLDGDGLGLGHRSALLRLRRRRRRRRRSRRRACSVETLRPRRAATERGHVLVLQRVEGRADHVVGVRRAQRLRDHVLHAERLEHGAHRAAGDDAGARRRRAQHDLAGAPAAVDVVMQRAALAQRHADQAALGRFGRLADRLRHFARLAVAEADAALLVADDDERGEAEAPAALHHLGDAVDVDELVDEFAVALFAVILAAAASCVLLPCHRLTCAGGGPARLNGFVSPADLEVEARPRGRRRPAP